MPTIRRLLWILRQTQSLIPPPSVFEFIPCLALILFAKETYWRTSVHLSLQKAILTSRQPAHAQTVYADKQEQNEQMMRDLASSCLHGRC